jgi:hypothetical protein
MKSEQNKKVEEILSSLDGCTKATAPDFLYTRLKARMEAQLKNASPASRSWSLRPVFAIAMAVVVLAINAFVLLQRGKTSSGITAPDADNLQSVAAEYRLYDNANVYDLSTDK